jgi:type II secretory pathway pseudopilin PulG
VPRRLARSDRGATLVELLVAVVLVVVLTAMSVPITRSAVDAGRVRHAAGFVASRFRLARHQAIFGGRSVGVVFDVVAGQWTLRVCHDGNGNGIRRAEIVPGGSDPCVDGPHGMSDMFPTVRVAVDPTLSGPAGEPGSADPVRFGRSDLISFSPDGSCTAGSLYLRSPDGVQYAVRVAGINGRLRVLRYDPASGTWVAL